MDPNSKYKTLKTFKKGLDGKRELVLYILCLPTFNISWFNKSGKNSIPFVCFILGIGVIFVWIVENVDLKSVNK